MKVENISNNISSSKIDDIEVIKRNLESIAKQHNTSVEELVAGARSAGENGLPYQIRVVNLANRLERLEK